ncbi:oxidoreductase [Treponema sp. C6A8]|uniref:oxidoreductase n=1 Tax=Treponema sp. C6A8 TaxID=1410609 RepID=UPI000483F184|nr:oxidoreductase [Treponema sp. C6A8]
MSKKVVLITGASSGIGLTTAKMLLKDGYTVYCAARRTELMESLKEDGGHTVFLDLNDDASIKSCVDSVLKAEGHVDILINNAGYATGGSLEDTSIEEAKRQFEVNVFGLIRITQLCLPSMREQKSGLIINISSMAGLFSSPFLGWYHAAKYSVEALSDSLRNEVKSFGIKVAIIEPGLIKTNWGVIAGNVIEKNSGSTAYKDNALLYSDFYKRNYNENAKVSNPSVISKAIYKAIKARNPKSRYRTGKYSHSFVFLKRILPDWLFDFCTDRLIKYFG